MPSSSLSPETVMRAGPSVVSMGKRASSLVGCSTLGSRPPPSCTGQHSGLALVAYVQVKKSDSVKSEGAAPAPDGYSTEGVSWGSVGELALVVELQEIWQGDQVSYHPGPDPRL